MAKSLTPPRGMRDFTPAAKKKRDELLGVIRTTFAKHGFDEIETPALENTDIIHSGTGGDNEKLAFRVLRRGIDADDLSVAAQSGDTLALSDIGLRFDLTVPLSRFFAAHRSELPSVFRSLHIGSVWRAERPQKGRYRQFLQCDIDVIGCDSQLAELELLTAGVDALAALGLRNCTIRANDRRILVGLLKYCGFAHERYEKVLISLDKLDKIGAEGVVKELSDEGSRAADVLGGILEEFVPHLEQGGVPLTVDAISALLPVDVDRDAVADLELLARSLADLPDVVQLRFDPTLVRGMGYYTGMIFEIMHPDSASSIAGGGRYDGMVGRLTGSPVPAVGLSLGFERIVELLDLPTRIDPMACVLVHDSDVSFAALMRIKTELIAGGHRVRFEKRTKNVSAVLDRAAALGYGQFAFVTREMSVEELNFKQLGS